VTLLGLAGLGDPVYPAPAANDSLDVAGGAGEADGQQAFLGFRDGHAGEGPHLGV
jgi:hypothetical protein